MQQRLPNFFLAGVPKTGTTSLYHYLRQHPDIYMSPLKEPTFFSQEARPENHTAEEQERIGRQSLQLRENLQAGVFDNLYRGIVTRWEDYLKLFADAKDEHAVGEASLSYLWSRTAAKEIAAVIPDAKFMLILRHPAERAFSEYVHQLSDGHVSHSFEHHLRRARQSDRKMSAYYPFLEFGEYAEQLERLFSYFPREQVRIWIYEDTLREPHQFRRQVFEFLGVDPEFVPDTSKRYYQMEIPRALPVVQVVRRSRIWSGLRRMMPAKLLPVAKRMVYRRHGALKLGKNERAFLVEYYREGIKNLECLLDRDLSGWFQ
jgi:hypothetical protein